MFFANQLTNGKLSASRLGPSMIFKNKGQKYFLTSGHQRHELWIAISIGITAENGQTVILIESDDTLSHECSRNADSG